MTKSLFLMMLSMAVTGCIYDTSSSGMPGEPQAAVAGNTEKSGETIKLSGNGPLGGYIEQFMDANDKSKMARALDGGLGKANHWKNPVSGSEFAVTPVSKASMSGGICRTYNVSMTRTGITDKVSGTACIGEDGVWHVAG